MNTTNKEEKFSKVYVLDTNIILNDANNLFTISQGGDNLIVLPETVIAEMDNKKSGFEDINFQAREFARLFSSPIILGAKEENGVSVVSLLVDKTLRVDIISKENYDLGSVDKSIINDRKIIEIAKYVDKHYADESIFLTVDVMCRITGILNNIKTDTLSFGKKDYSLNFIKELKVENLAVHGREIIEVDPNYSYENYCYVFKSGNKELVSIIKDGLISVINENDLKRSSIKPRNQGQVFALQGMLDPYYNIVLIEAKAGSGKTLLAVSSALRNVDKKRYDKIIYIRNSVESVDRGEDVGYLSGNEEKFKIYNYPLYDVLDMIVRSEVKKNRKTKEESSEEDIQARIEKMIKSYNIETMWIGAIRGRTLSNAFVIVDEIQNFSKKSLQTVLSRLDSNCKVVCIGSNAQIDNSYINKYTNGLNVLLESAANENKEIKMFASKLEQVERGAITEWTEKTFS